MKNSKLISIALTTYNGGKYLEEQLESIYKQSYNNIEVIAVDDCSIDATVTILKKYNVSHGLKYYINEKNIGYVKNFERAISLCKGEYIALSDQDDIWSPNKLSILMAKIGSYLMIHSDCSIINHKNKIVISSWKRENGYKTNVENMLFKNVVTGCTVLFDKKLLDYVLPFPENVTYHDWWLGLCAAEKHSLKYTSECLTHYRVHMSQNTGIGDNYSILKRVFLNIKNRYLNIDFSRKIGYRKHLDDLYVLKNDIKYCKVDNTLLNDAIIYFEDYLQYQIHIKTFYIGIKYHKVLYPHKNYLYLKNILMDIVG